MVYVFGLNGGTVTVFSESNNNSHICAARTYLTNYYKHKIYYWEQKFYMASARYTNALRALLLKLSCTIWSPFTFYTLCGFYLYKVAQPVISKLNIVILETFQKWKLPLLTKSRWADGAGCVRRTRLFKKRKNILAYLISSFIPRRNLLRSRVIAWTFGQQLTGTHLTTFFITYKIAFTSGFKLCLLILHSAKWPSGLIRCVTSLLRALPAHEKNSNLGAFQWDSHKVKCGLATNSAFSWDICCWYCSCASLKNKKKQMTAKIKMSNFDLSLLCSWCKYEFNFKNLIDKT